MAGLCASVLREPGHTPAAGAASASVTASVFAAGMAESCMDMSMLPDGKASLYKPTHSVSGGVSSTAIEAFNCFYAIASTAYTTQHVSQSARCCATNLCISCSAKVHQLMLPWDCVQ